MARKSLVTEPVSLRGRMVDKDVREILGDGTAVTKELDERTTI